MKCSVWKRMLGFLLVSAQLLGLGLGLTIPAAAADTRVVQPYARSNVYAPDASSVGNSAYEFRMGYTGQANGYTAIASWNFEGAYSSCSFSIGYVSGKEENAEMTVVADGVTIYNKVTLKPEDGARRFTVELTGVRKLTITLYAGEYDTTRYGISDMVATLAGEAPSTEAIKSDEFYDVTRSDGDSVSLQSEPFSMGGRTFADGYSMRMGYVAGYTAYVTFNFNQGYKSMSFDIAKYMNRPSESYLRSAFLTITADGNVVPGYDGLELKWDDLLRSVEVNLEGVTQLVISLESRGYDAMVWNIGNIQLKSDGKAHGVLLSASKGTVTSSAREFDLNPRVYPSDAKNKNYTIESDSSITVAMLDNRWAIGRSSGKATITATTEDGGHTATCVITSRLPAAKFVPSRDGWGIKNYYRINEVSDLWDSYYKNIFLRIVGKSPANVSNLPDPEDTLPEMASVVDFLWGGLVQACSTGGQCHGLSLAALLTYTKAIPFSSWDISEQYENPYDIKSDTNYFPYSNEFGYSEDVDLYLKQYIFACHLSQATVTYQFDKFLTWNNYESLFKAVENFRSTGKDPVILRLVKDSMNHSIVPYEVVRGEDYVRLFVYDCNLYLTGGFEPESGDNADFDVDDVYIHFSLDDDGKVESWHYGTDYDSNDTTLSYADNLMGFAGNLKKKIPADFGKYIYTDALNFNVSIGGKSVLRSANGVITTEQDQDLAFPLTLTGASTGGNAFSGSTICLTGEMDCELHIQDSGEHTTIYFDDDSAAVVVASGDSVIVRNEDVMTITPEQKQGVTVRYNTSEGSVIACGDVEQSVTLRIQENQAVFQGFTMVQATTSTSDGKTETGEPTKVNPNGAYTVTSGGAMAVMEDISFTDMHITDSSGNQLTAIPDADFRVDVVLHNKSFEDSCTVMVAIYDEHERYIGAQTASVNIPKGETGEVSFLVENRSGKVAQVRAFCVTALGNPVPLALDVSIK